MNKPTSEREQKWEKMRKRVVIHVHFGKMSSAYLFFSDIITWQIFHLFFIAFADTHNILGENSAFFLNNWPLIASYFFARTNSTLFRQHFIWWKLKKTISYDKLFIFVVASWLAQLYYMWVLVGILPFPTFFLARTSLFSGFLLE